MSYEVFGDNDNPAAEGFLEMGWWTDEQAKEVTDAVQALCDEKMYEGNEMSNGVSVRFIARLTLLRAAVGLPVDERLRREAEQMFPEERGQ